MSPSFRCVRVFCGLLLVAATGPATVLSEPPEVPVSKPVSRMVPDVQDFTGRTQASAEVEIRPLVDGLLVKIPFKPGSVVREGDLLFQTDPRAYQAELDRATAILQGVEARARANTAELARTKRLQENGHASKEELDLAIAKHEESAAAVRTARASLDRARIDLDSTRILAPLAGTIGRPLLDRGNFVRAGVTALATIIAADPAFATFEMDEHTFLHFRRRALEVKPGARGGEALLSLPISLGLSDEKDFPHQGKVDFVDNHAEPAKGTISCRGVFPNPDGLLLPGLFARIRLQVSAPRARLLVPERALLIEQGRKFVYVVNGKDVVESRPVQIGAAANELRVITEGLTGDESVVVDKVRSLSAGQQVKPRVVPIP